MFSDEEIKETPEGSFMRPGDEIISIREVCLDDKFDKKDLGFKSEQLLGGSGRNELFRDGFFSETCEQQARFAWTEEDGNIAALVSEPGFGTTGHTTFGKELEAALKSEMKEADTSSSLSMLSPGMSALDLSRKTYPEPHVSSTSAANGSSSGLSIDKAKPSQANCKVDKTDPRTRFHYVKYLNRRGRTVKLWECGICSREFQHQYTLMRHLPTHTDERNFHCDSCGKSFRQLSTLSQHRAIHSAERPYGCEVCTKTFNRVSTLISHRKTHSDQKPYKCHICPKGFHQKGNLRNHLFTHTNERPYRCNICSKGFNQQSNLVCHKNKVHPDESSGATNTTITNADPLSPRDRRTPRIGRTVADTRAQPDSTISSVEHCEVSSSVGSYPPSMEGPSSSNWTPKPISWEIPIKPHESDFWTMNGNGGVIVEPIKTYHMGVALATQQTPFALLRPDQGPPVLVKVVDTKLPGGKQMLVPATAEDLRIGGKIVMNNEENPTQNDQVHEGVDRAVQIRVPVVATVVPKIRPGGRLHLAVEEPHHSYTALSADVGEIRVEPCTLRESRQVLAREQPIFPRPEALRRLDSVSLPPLIAACPEMRPGTSISSSCVLSPPAPSPPLDLISMDLFESMECTVPMGPQITAVGNIDRPPASDDSDIFIGEFEETIALSDSD